MAALLLAGCGVQSPNGPALHRAVLRGDMAEVQRILEKDPSAVRATDEAGMTALHFAVARLRMAPDAHEAPPSAETQNYQPGCGAQASFTTYDLENVRSRRAMPALYTTEDQAPMAELLIRHGAPLEADTRAFGTPLQLAAMMGHLTVVRLLLDHGANIAATDMYGLTALHKVAQSGNVAIARLLLERGADSNAQVGQSGFLLGVMPGFQNDTPLSLAIICNHREMVELLLQHGANPNLRAQDGFAPLHLAERADIAALLLAHGASLEIRGYENRTPLDQAAMRGWLDVAELFLARGADIEAKDNRGRTPLLFAIEQPPGSYDMAAFLIAKGAHVNIRAADGTTPLLAALGHLNFVTLLLDSGADVNAPDQYGRTPLHRAVESNDVALVTLLLDRGAKVNLRDSTNRTPLYYTWGGSSADREIADILRRHGGV